MEEHLREAERLLKHPDKRDRREMIHLNGSRDVAVGFRNKVEPRRIVSGPTAKALHAGRRESIRVDRATCDVKRHAGRVADHHQIHFRIHHADDGAL